MPGFVDRVVGYATRRRHGAFVLFLLALGLALPVESAAQTKVLQVYPGAHNARRLRAPASADSSSQLQALRPLLQRRWESELRVRRELGPHGVSAKGLRSRDRRVANLRKDATATAEPETLRILLVRIAFDTDRSGSLTSITEDGDFLYEPDPDAFIDPPPHDRAFFEAHLQGLEAYWNSMSAGQLHVEAKVLPPGDQDAYKLSDIADYGPGRGGNWDLDRLEKLVQDMIVAADEGSQADGSANLSDYDFDDPNTYVIFAHAGGDLQSNIVFDENDPDYSPNDIPTFFVTLGDSASVDLTSTDSDTGQRGRMTECSVIPESTSQDGLVGSIAAAFYHEFGHALGLPDLYSTQTGLPTVGYWDIMDTGTNLASVVQNPDTGEPVTVIGLLPPQTSAWCKWYLGFADEVRIGGRHTHQVLRGWRKQDNREKVLRLDVSPNEFYLVTSRWVPFVSNPNWFLRRDPDTKVILYMANYKDPENPVNAHIYDFSLPWGGGVMVWKVRQDRIDESIALNQVQTLPRKLGVELVEADGIKDLGIFDFTTVGFVGSSTDAFRAFTPAPAVDPPIDDYPETQTSFGPDTFPASTSTIGIPTGVHIENIPLSKDGPIYVDTWIDGLLNLDAGDGFPVEVAPSAAAPMRGDARSLTPMPFAAGPAILVVAQSADRTSPPGLYAYAYDGSPLFTSARIFDFGGDLAGSPTVVADFDGSTGLLAVERDGTVHAFDDAGPLGVENLLQERPNFPAALTDSVDQALLALDDAVVATSLADGRIEVLGFDGIRHDDWSQAMTDGLQLRSAPVVARIQDGATPTMLLAFVSDRGLELRTVQGASPASGPATVEWAEGTGDRPGYLVALANSDSTASDALVFVDDLGRVSRFAEAGGTWTEEGFGHDLDGAPIAPPAGGDVNGDGKLDWVAVTARRLYARGPSGAALYGFPIDVTDRRLLREEHEDRFDSAPVIADIDGDGTNEILEESSFGILHGIESDGGFVEGFPQERSGGGALAPLLVDTGGSGSRRALFLYEALGDTLRPGRRTRNARLNAVDLGPSPTSNPTFEWLGLAGSAARSGRAGYSAPSANSSATAARLDADPTIYPNPLRGDMGATAHVRFYSGSAQTARLTIYSLEGEQLVSLTRDVAGGQTEEIPWDTTGIAPGPYLFRLEYVGSDGPQTRLMTFYVER